MKTITREIEYKILTNNDDVNDDFVQKCIDKNRDINVCDDWHYYTIEDFTTICELMGYSDINVMYSGFWSQGDGASFTAKYSYEKGSIKNIKEYAPKDEELHRIAKELQLLAQRCRYSMNAKIYQRGNYCHSNTMYCEYLESDIVEEFDNDFEYIFLELSRDLADWLYKTLEKEYEYLTSDKVVFDTLVANEYEFNNNGEII